MIEYDLNYVSYLEADSFGTNFLPKMKWGEYWRNYLSDQTRCFSNRDDMNKRQIKNIRLNSARRRVEE